MPESCRDRPTSAHEKLFLLTKSGAVFLRCRGGASGRVSPATTAPIHKQWCMGDGGRPKDQRHGGEQRVDPVSGPTSATSGPSTKTGNISRSSTKAGQRADVQMTLEDRDARLQRGSFRDLPAQVSRTVHQGWHERERRLRRVRGAVGADRCKNARQVSAMPQDRRRTSGRGDRGKSNMGTTELEPTKFTTTGWSPSCDHDSPTIPATCLDPFAGSGTVGLGRRPPPARRDPDRD